MHSPVILSIDIGIHNLGYAIYDKNTKSEQKKEPLIFGLYDLDDNIEKKDKKNNIVITRTKYINKFVKKIFKNHQVNTVIIERQVNTNTRAMELMYLLTATIYNYCEDIIIFDPKLKFTKTGLIYNTKNKAHKKLSIKVIREYITNNYPSLLDSFENYDKKDDISDAVFMLLIYRFENDKNKLSILRNYGED